MNNIFRLPTPEELSRIRGNMAESRSPPDLNSRPTNYGFFPFYRYFVLEDIWGNLNRVDRSVLSTIIAYSNNGVAKISVRKIASIIGGSHGDIVKALDRCEGTFYDVERYKTRYTDSARKFNFYEHDDEAGTVFLYNYLVHSGLWGKLTHSERSLYIVMRVYHEFNDELASYHNEAYGTEFEYSASSPVSEWYGNRRFDFCPYKKAFLAKKAGVSLSTVKRALNGLTGHQLIQRCHTIEYAGYLTYFLPTDGDTNATVRADLCYEN